MPEKLCRFNDNERTSHKKEETLRYIVYKEERKIGKNQIKTHSTLIERSILKAPESFEGTFVVEFIVGKNGHDWKDVAFWVMNDKKSKCVRSTQNVSIRKPFLHKAYNSKMHIFPQKKTRYRFSDFRIVRHSQLFLKSHHFLLLNFFSCNFS